MADLQGAAVPPCARPNWRSSDPSSPWEIFAGLFAGKGEPFAVESEAARGPSALRAERRSPDVVGAEAGAAGGPAKSGVVNHYGPSKNQGPLPEKIANTFRKRNLR